MVGASQRVVHNLADAELCAAMQAAVVVRMDFALRVTPQDDVRTEPMQSARLCLHMLRLTHRVPHAMETEFEIGFEFG